MLFFGLSDSSPVTLFAPINSIGLKGNITFYQERNGTEVEISINLMTQLPMNGTVKYTWAIHAYPYFYGTTCKQSELGKKEHDMSAKFGSLEIPQKETLKVSDSSMTLYGLGTIWGRSILFKNGNEEGCANIGLQGEVKTAEAKFGAPFAGTVLFRENERGETLIFSNLFYTSDEYKASSKHDWKILVTDILDTKREQKCSYLSTLLDPDNIDDKLCSNTNHVDCKIGDMTKKHNQIIIGAQNNRYSKQIFLDNNLPLSLLSGSRSLYLVIYEKGNPSHALSCAMINLIDKKEVKAIFEMDGVRGSIGFSQTYLTDPTIVTINLNNLKERGKMFHIHEFPVPPKINSDDKLCSDFSVGRHFDPLNAKEKTIPPNAIGTSDQYEMGDLSGKYGPLVSDEKGNYFQIHIDFNLPLFGLNSIIGRSIVIHKPDSKRWICSSIGYPGITETARATFYYPVVGHVIFRQEKDKPFSETTVFADLSYSDGSINNTDSHAWHIHEFAPGRDFYNWSRRCESVGRNYNPFNVGTIKYSKCGKDNPFRCELGDMTSKSQKLKIAGIRGAIQTKVFFTDIMLALSGQYSILDRGVVIHDDNAPQQRGNRLACAGIKKVYPLHVSARKWRVGSGIGSNVSGVFNFYQFTEYDLTSGKIELYGLNKIASRFHVHEVWVPIDKEFPCSEDSVYDYYNPYKMDSDVTHLSGVGSRDQYQIGDLYGKLGSMDNLDNTRFEFIDSNLPLHGTNSITGRSIVIHKKVREERWVCATLVPEENEHKARRIVAIATFDNSQHEISGYIRFSQFEYKDGSLSDTWIEVNLKHPGKFNRNVTHGHNWSVFVSQVGSDAYVPQKEFRCLAAGYRWNPYLTDSERNVELYKKDCNKLNLLRCEMGDLTGRHGQLTIGSKRMVLSDPNLPLAGNYSVMRRSIVIFDKNDSNIKLACTNILPDIHLVTTISVRKFPAFTVSKFMDDMKTLLNTTDWLVAAEIQSTKVILNGECIQLSVNFYGKQKFSVKT